MICYRDMTFCSHYEDCKDAAQCNRPLTLAVRESAAAWWTGEGDAPICTYTYQPDCHLAKAVSVDLDELLERVWAHLTPPLVFFEDRRHQGIASLASEDTIAVVTHYKPDAVKALVDVANALPGLLERLRKAEAAAEKLEAESEGEETELLPWQPDYGTGSK